MPIAPEHFTLICPTCRSSKIDDGLTLDCTSDHKPALLLTSYKSKRFSPDPLAEGIYRYRSWLPVRRELQGSPLPAVFKSDALNSLVGLENLWLAFSGYWPCRGVIALKNPADYHDATLISENLVREPPFFAEGGVKNVARRDGIGTMLLKAVECIGMIPDYYFQAVGGGVGAIAVFETSKRLIEDGRFGSKLPRLILSQNSPFTPMVDAWHSRRNMLLPLDRELARKRMSSVIATVLSSYRPAYSVTGGIFDALIETHGDMISVGNDEVEAAVNLFERLEGIDIDPAAGVALASMLKYAPKLQSRRKSTVLLHLTGGGRGLRNATCRLKPVRPTFAIGSDHAEVRRALDFVLR